LGLAMIAESRSEVVLVAGLCFMAVGVGVKRPVLTAMGSDYAGGRHRGALLGFAPSAGGLARALGPVFSGFLFSALGAGAPFFSGAAATVLFALVAATLRRGERVAALSP